MMPLPKSLKILLVEDDSFSLRAHHKLLGDLGYFPDTAETGQHALSLPTHDYHLILMDIGLPDIHGAEVTAQIRHRQHTHHRPRIIGLTAFSTPDVVADCFSAGMDEVIAKPLTIAKLSRLLAATVAPHTEVSYA